MAPRKEVPYEIRKVTPSEDKLIKKCLLGYTKPFVKCGKNEYVMPGSFKKCAEEIYNIKVRPDDVWVITFPRSGTTWTQEMVWLLKNDLDYQTAKEVPLYERFPMLEITTQVPALGFELIKLDFMQLGKFQGLSKAVRVPSWKSLEEAPSPRFIKTHLPLSLLPPDLLTTAKVVYVARDPRDVAVSYYYLHKLVYGPFYRMNFKKFWEVYRRDLLPWTPVIAHTNEAWEQRHNKNLHFMFYEDMLKDLPKTIRGLSKFLGENYVNEQIEPLAKYLSFDNLKKNKTVNNTVSGSKKLQFLRKGESGGWRSHFTDEVMMQQADEFLSSRLQGLDLKYPTLSTNIETEFSHL